MTQVFLFSEQITQPQCAASALPKGINAGAGFVEFWLAYPKGPRKADKQKCLNKWARYQCAFQAKHILAYLEWMKTQPDWTKDNGSFICAPVVWLNRQGWIDWQPEPERPKKPDAWVELDNHKGSPMPEAVREKLMHLKMQLKERM